MFRRLIREAKMTFGVPLSKKEINEFADHNVELMSTAVRGVTKTQSDFYINNPEFRQRVRDAIYNPDGQAALQALLDVMNPAQLVAVTEIMRVITDNEVED